MRLNTHYNIDIKRHKLSCGGTSFPRWNDSDNDNNDDFMSHYVYRFRSCPSCGQTFGKWFKRSGKGSSRTAGNHGTATAKKYIELERNR